MPKFAQSVVALVILLCVEGGKLKIRDIPDGSFLKNIVTSSDHTFILFYKRGCGNCRAVMPMYETLNLHDRKDAALIFPKGSSFTIAKADLQRSSELAELAANDRPGEGTTSYPVLKYYKQSETAVVNCQLMGREMTKMTAKDIVDHMMKCVAKEQEVAAEEKALATPDAQAAAAAETELQPIMDKPQDVKVFASNSRLPDDQWGNKGELTLNCKAVGKPIPFPSLELPIASAWPQTACSESTTFQHDEATLNRSAVLVNDGLCPHEHKLYVLENHTVHAMVVLSRKADAAAYEKLDPALVSKGVHVIVCPKAEAAQLRALYDISAEGYEKKEAHMSVGSRQTCDEPESKANVQVLRVSPA
jgi:hypothetical protein